jgi:hypothetical protein
MKERASAPGFCGFAGSRPCPWQGDAGQGLRGIATAPGRRQARQLTTASATLRICRAARPDIPDRQTAGLPAKTSAAPPFPASDQNRHLRGLFRLPPPAAAQSARAAAACHCCRRRQLLTRNPSARLMRRIERQHKYHARQGELSTHTNEVIPHPEYADSALAENLSCALNPRVRRSISGGALIPTWSFTAPGLFFVSNLTHGCSVVARAHGPSNPGFCPKFREKDARITLCDARHTGTGSRETIPGHRRTSVIRHL